MNWNLLWEGNSMNIEKYTICSAAILIRIL